MRRASTTSGSLTPSMPNPSRRVGRQREGFGIDGVREPLVVDARRRPAQAMIRPMAAPSCRAYSTARMMFVVRPAPQSATEALTTASAAMDQDPPHSHMWAPILKRTNMEKATFGAGCFWGVEAAFRQIDGVISTAVGYSGGRTANPTYRDVCSD